MVERIKKHNRSERKQQELKVLFVGYGELGASVLSGLLNSNCAIDGVINWDTRERKSIISKLLQFKQEDPIEDLIKKNKLNHLPIDRLNNYKFVEMVKSLNIDVIFIACWGEILQPYVFESPNLFTINCHPSYLPWHRGSNPYASVIVQGEEFTGVTFHIMDEGIDTGPILVQKELPIAHEETGYDLKLKCCVAAEDIVPQLIEDICHNTLHPTEQPPGAGSYFSRLKPIDGNIDWSEPSLKIYNKIRGLTPWIKCLTAYNKQLFIIENSAIMENDGNPQPAGTIIRVTNSEILVATGSKDSFLLLKDVYVYGIPKIFSKMYIRHKMQPGTSFYTPDLS